MKVAPGTLAVAVARSQNEKIGEAATTYAAQTSCPPDCIFFDGGGCYAETGMVGKFVTAPLNAAANSVDHTPVDVARAEAEAIDGLEVAPGRPLRLHTVGDCATDEAARLVAAAAERYTDRGGGPVWMYTHGWRGVARESWGEISVLASCETPLDVALARARGYATAIVVEEFASGKRYTLSEPEGRLDSSGDQSGHGSLSGSLSVLPCPAQTRGVPCSDCRLCFDDVGIGERGYSIGFELHGIPYALRQGRRALREPENPRRRLIAEDELRELLAERPGLSAREAAIAISLGVSYAGQLLAFLRGEAKHPSVLRRERYERRKAA